MVALSCTEVERAALNHGEGARPRRCADVMFDWVCVRPVCAYLVPRRIVAVERTCRAVQESGIGSVWSSQGTVQAQLLVIVDSEWGHTEDGLDRRRYPLFAWVLTRMVRERGVRDVLMLLTDIVRRRPWSRTLS